jgi:Zn-dependent membrane protease YugP
MDETFYYWIAAAVFGMSMLVQQKLKANYRKWSRVANRVGMTGAESAQRILWANGMQNVGVGPIRGTLTDHYNPRKKEIRLSQGIYGTPSVAAIAIAAHESGHAIQDQVDYWPLEFRSALAPLAATGARFGLPAAIIGSMAGMPLLVQIGVIGYAGALLLQFLTLPVEFNASKRALEQLDALGLLGPEERDGVRAMLRSAAMTYVAGVASAAGYFIYLAFLGRRRMARGAGAEPPLKPPPAV